MGQDLSFPDFYAFSFPPPSKSTVFLIDLKVCLSFDLPDFAFMLKQPHKEPVRID
jgi:hypothetical protein